MIIHTITDSLQGNMREIVGTIKLRELCNDRKKFGDEVQSKAQLDMDNLGIQIISCNIQTITDEQELIPQLGQDNMSQIQKDASIAKAQAERDVAIAEAEAKRMANEAQVAAQTEIASRQNELRIREAELIRQWPKRPGEEKEAVGDYELKPDDRITLGVINGRITDVIRDKRSRTDVTELTEVNSRTRAIIEIAKDRGVTLPLIDEDWQIIHPTDETATKFELNY